MRVYLVIEHDWEDDTVDSVWTSRKAAQVRSDAIPYSWVHTFAVDVESGETDYRPNKLVGDRFVAKRR